MVQEGGLIISAGRNEHAPLARTGVEFEFEFCGGGRRRKSMRHVWGRSSRRNRNFFAFSSTLNLARCRVLGPGTMMTRLMLCVRCSCSSDAAELVPEAGQEDQR